MKNKAIRICIIIMAAFLLCGAAFYFIAGDSLRFTTYTTGGVNPQGPQGPLLAGSTLEQSFKCHYDDLNALTIKVATYNRANSDILKAELLDESGIAIRQIELDTSAMIDNDTYTISFDPPVENVLEKTLTLRLTSQAGTHTDAVALYYGTSAVVDTGRFSVPIEIDLPGKLVLNGEALNDTEGAPMYLCLSVIGTNHHFFGEYYWFFYAGASLLLLLYLLFIVHCYNKKKKEPVLSVILSLVKYNFLIRQLVARDFKTKYKRSVLGMLWSFLNPLLTMSIQYVVFSTIFSSNIPNFVVYLLSGIICFNFFNEATNMCLMSIVGNASLINKVYMPKYIYPFSRTLSSGINLLLSLVPLFIMLLVTGTPITPAILLLPFGLLCLFMLSYGIGVLLATMMVFFRDTQFLWGIFSMLLMYLTPIFYPETIIPASFLPIYRLNPLYQILSFVRKLLIDGVSPAPKEYFTCFVLCAIPFAIGMWVFRRNQNKFVLNI